MDGYSKALNAKKTLACYGRKTTSWLVLESFPDRPYNPERKEKRERALNKAAFDGLASEEGILLL